MDSRKSGRVDNWLIGLVLMVGMSLAAAGCGGGGGGASGAPSASPPPTTQPPQPVAASIQLSTSTLNLAALGDTSTITAAVRDSSGNTISGASVTWSSANSAVATVSSTGLVTAIANGQVTLTARTGSGAQSVEATAQVTVQQRVAQIQVTPGAQIRYAHGVAVAYTATAKDSRGNDVSGASLSWSSSDPDVSKVSVGSGNSATATTVSDGTAQITATADGASGGAQLRVVTHEVDPVPSALATPASGALWEIPVLILRYIPTLDGVTVDQSEAIIGGPVEGIKRRIEILEERVKFMLEEGSRFRGYQNPNAPYSLGYRILRIETVYSHLPRGRRDLTGADQYQPDYQQMLSRANAEYWVNERGVKEIWVWGYHSDTMYQPESNMASPVTGDISNSWRYPDDLPIYNHTYTLYGYNFARGNNEAVHNHGHQLEAILAHVDRNMFWREFVGQNAQTGAFITGRSGWTHMPPNTTNHYDYASTTVVESDIADWRPGGGQTTPVSVNTWASVPYNWPTPWVDGETAQSKAEARREENWYVYWMQSMPGRDNGIPYGTGQLTNWWRFTGDWDGAIRDGYGLVTNPSRIAIRNDYVGGVALNPGGNLAPGQSVTLPASAPMTVSVWDCGEPGGCKWDPYVLQPDRSYAVITDPAGPEANLTIVERSSGAAAPGANTGSAKPQPYDQYPVRH